VAALFTAALKLIGIFIVLELLFAEAELTSSDVKLVLGIDVELGILVDYCTKPWFIKFLLMDGIFPPYFTSSCCALFK
jgi:hypothetical protein